MMTRTEIEDKIADQARRVAIARQNVHGAKGHRIALAATNLYLRAKEELDIAIYQALSRD